MTDPHAEPHPARTANVIGLGLIGGSIALALRASGFRVHGLDDRSSALAAAVEREVIHVPGLDPDAEVTFVAVPVLHGTGAVLRALAETTGLVTDVGSVKAPICSAVTDRRFIGGHPMAGSERDGLDGADSHLFEGAIWVLTPDSAADDAVFARLAGVIKTFGAEVVALDPERHDEVVAVVSHVPHLTAATLMGLAADRSLEHAALLRLAAGGFRDMTRVASGRPDIWLDICDENRAAIVRTLTELIDGLSEVRAAVDRGDRDHLYAHLQGARDARANLPGRVVHPEDLAEVRFLVPDRTGVAAEVFGLAAELGVNIANFEVVHRADAPGGTVVMLLDRTQADAFRLGLIERGYHPTVEVLT